MSYEEPQYYGICPICDQFRLLILEKEKSVLLHCKTCLTTDVLSRSEKFSKKDYYDSFLARVSEATKHFLRIIILKIEPTKFDFARQFLRESYPTLLKIEQKTGLPIDDKTEKTISLRCSKNDLDVVKGELVKNQVVFSTTRDHSLRRDFSHYYNGKIYNMPRKEFRKKVTEEQINYFSGSAIGKTEVTEQPTFSVSRKTMRVVKREIRRLLLLHGSIRATSEDELIEWIVTKTKKYSTNAQKVKRLLVTYLQEGLFRLAPLETGAIELSYNPEKTRDFRDRKTKGSSPLKIKMPRPLTNYEKIMSKMDAIKEIRDVLVLSGFSMEEHEDYIVADRFREFGPAIRLFISLQDKKNSLFKKYIDEKITIVFHASKFRQRLRNLLDWWFSLHTIHAGELGTNVLTHFGWHAYLTEDIRQEALVSATNELKEQHVTDVLLLLKNWWPNNPNIPEEYSFNVSQDYVWYRSNIGQNARCFRLKNELLQRLQFEYQRLIGEGLIRLPHSRAIERFFVITYFSQ